MESSTNTKTGPSAPPASDTAEWDALALQYHEEVISPYARGVDFPLHQDIDHMVRRWRRDHSSPRRVAAEFGCGIGEALPWFAGRVGVSMGLDFSRGMLEQSSIRLKGHGIKHEVRLGQSATSTFAATLAKAVERRETEKRTWLVEGNMLKLGTLKSTCDLALAINSIVAPTLKEELKMLRQIADCMKKDATLLAVFPSLDTMDHLFKLAARSSGEPPDLGTIVGPDRIYIHTNGEAQKYLTPDEIRAMADEVGLNIRRIEKITYPWRMVQRYGWGYYPRAPRLWDWYVEAVRA